MSIFIVHQWVDSQGTISDTLYVPLLLVHVTFHNPFHYPFH